MDHATAADLYAVARKAAKGYLAQRPYMSPAYGDDILSDACWGAALAIANHNTDKGASLRNRVYVRANGAIADGVRDRAPVSRTEHRQGKTLADLPAHRQLPVPSHMLAELGWAEPSSPRSFEDEIGDADLVDRLLAACTDRERLVLTESLLYGYSLTEIAERLGVSLARVSQIRTAACQRLRRQFAEAVAA